MDPEFTDQADRDREHAEFVAQKRAELLEEVKNHGDAIFVRAFVDDKWQTVSFNQCNEAIKERYIALWVSKNMTPVRVSDPRENLP